MPPKPIADTTYRKPINFTPNAKDAELLRELDEKVGLTGGPLVRVAIKALVLRHRRLDQAFPPSATETARRARKTS